MPTSRRESPPNGGQDPEISAIQRYVKDMLGTLEAARARGRALLEPQIDKIVMGPKEEGPAHLGR